MALVPEKLNNNLEIFHGRMGTDAKKKKKKSERDKGKKFHNKNYIHAISFYIKF